MTWLSPTRWLILATLAASLWAGYGLWATHQQGIGYDKAQAEYTAAALVAEQAARAKEQALQDQVTKAQNDAKKRQNELQADAAGARAAVVSLRNQLAASRASVPTLTRDAVNRYADAASVVFAKCAASYSELADMADRIDSERQTLIDAWPK